MASARIQNLKQRFTVDIAVVIGQRSVEVDDDLRNTLKDMRAKVNQLLTYAKGFENKLKDLEAQDKLGNFEIQDLMSTFNQAETLASSILKKRDETASAIV